MALHIISVFGLTHLHSKSFSIHSLTLIRKPSHSLGCYHWDGQQAWHLYQNGIVSGEKGTLELWEMFIFFTKVIIIEQENLSLEENISCLGLRVLTVGRNAIIFLSSVFFISNSTEFPAFNYHLQKKKRIQNCTFNYHFFSMQLLFPTIPWTCCLGPPSPHPRLKYTRSTGKICVSILLTPTHW